MLGVVQMEKTKKIVSEIHLYENKIEALIKVLIWIISCIGGIVVLLGEKNKEVLGSAYFIYTLSLLMEFAPKIYGKTEFWSKFLHTLFCFAMSIVCLLSLGTLLGVSLSDTNYEIMLLLIFFIIAYMVIDLFILWLEPDSSLMNYKDSHICEEMDKQQLMFSQRLTEGNLGNINRE